MLIKLYLQPNTPCKVSTMAGSITLKQLHPSDIQAACCDAQAYDNELLARVERGLLQWLCQQVESDLRLHLHAAQEPGLSLNSASSAMRSVLPLIKLAPIRLHTRVLCIRWDL